MMKKNFGLIICCLAACLSIQAQIQDTYPYNVVTQIFSLLQEHGQQGYIGEKVSQLEHALQAAWFAQLAGGDDELIIAALLHDIGHLCASQDSAHMEQYGVAQHENIGGDFLAQHGFSEKIVALVKGHVDAKRYLAYKDPEFVNNLSQASRETLRMQGGIMNEEQAKLFELDPFFKDILLVRDCDDKAKVVDAIVPGLEMYREMFINHLKAHQIPLILIREN